jgi:hypothetical protein
LRSKTQPAQSAHHLGEADITFSNKMRKQLQLSTAVALCIFGCTMLIAGFVCPPLGEIHPTILTAFGEVLTFSGALLGMDYKYRSKE